MKKNYVSSPLPFQGQKRGFVKEFKKALEQFPSDAIYVDLFGGSGLLSRVVKDVYPNATVVYNDYDGVSKRLKAIPQTNKLLTQIRKIVVDIPRAKKLPIEIKNKVLLAIRKHKRTYGYVDCVTISASILFSGNICMNIKEFEKITMYNAVRKSDFEYSLSYLNGLEVVSCDYQELYAKYKDKPNIVFLIDPPYLSTDIKSYNNDGYWKLSDYLDVLSVLDNKRYFYFTSNKSHLVELCEWFGERFNANPFVGAVKVEVSNSVNFQYQYQDIMLYRP